jgi:ABC-type uncharacterized transport system permease subunit
MAFVELTSSRRRLKLALKWNSLVNPTFLPFLLAIFIIHLLVFGRLALRTRAGYYLSLVGVFTCLSVAVGLRIWQPALNLGPLSAWHLFRWTAWGFSLLAFGQFWWAYRRKKRGRS